jgi:hypothetical protein
MPPLSSAALLAVWESVSARSAAERALSLLATSEPQTPVEELARLSVGQRDVRLFELRAATFGDRLEIVGTCPECASPFELETRVRDLLVDSRRDLPVDIRRNLPVGIRRDLPVGSRRDLPVDTRDPGAVEEVEADEVRVRFRLPDSTDLAATERNGSARLLFERCIVDSSIAVAALPDAIVDAVAKRIRELDPQSEVELVLACPACDHRWRDLFDIASYFWTEIEALAMRLLQEVHVLARAYAWPEADILAMTPRRRRFYLDLIAT